MQALDFIFSAMSWLDALAVLLFFICVTAATWVIERDGTAQPSLARLMARHRQRWMELMAQREVRIMDSTLLSIQHRGAAFFASAVMIAIGGVAAVIGSTDRLLDLAQDLTADGVAQDRSVWEVKLLFLFAVLVVGFLKFVWAHRLFGYCAILIGATPLEPGAERDRIVHQAGRFNLLAGRSFNRGLRLVYFALASMAWLLGADAFIIATLCMSAMLYRREFMSETRRAVMEDSAEP
ncbi:MAG: DUF599 domain-containing protein [Neomegalonema sp.]|nr:DUF599 domain-containing protein [Neomegalonema sp.]